MERPIVTIKGVTGVLLFLKSNDYYNTITVTLEVNDDQGSHAEFSRITWDDVELVTDAG